MQFANICHLNQGHRQGPPPDSSVLAAGGNAHCRRDHKGTPKCTSGKGSWVRQLSHHPLYSQAEPDSIRRRGKTIFTSLSFTTSVLQESTSSHASHPDAARRAVGQLINSLCRGQERILVCRRNVFVWAEKGIAEGKSPLPCGPALHRRGWSTTSCLPSYLNREAGRSDFEELPVFLLQFGFGLTLLSTPLSSPSPSPPNNALRAIPSTSLQPSSWSLLLPACSLPSLPHVPSFPPMCS